MAIKDDLPDEINDDGFDDINEADDNFGLPDVEYEPLDRDAISSEIDDVVEEVESSIEEPEVAEDSYEEAVKNESEYVPGSYEPKYKESRSGLWWFLGIMGIVAIAVLAYFFIYKPGQEQKMLAEQEQLRQEEADRQAKIEADKKREEEAAQAAAAQAAREAEEENSAADDSAETADGVVTQLTGRTGRYYVIIASALDGDLAMDHARKIAADGNNLSLIPPFGNKKFYRVAIQDFDSFNDAQQRADELKSELGDGLWVLKY